MRRPLGVSPALAVLLAVLLAGAALGVAALRDDREPAPPAATSPPPPAGGLVVEGRDGHPRPGELAAARGAAERFVRSFLPVLYGRATVGTVRAASPALRADLRRVTRRVPPAMRERTPRVVRLEVVEQAPGAVQATATIADGDVSTFPLVVYLERARGARWEATRLGDD